MPTPGAPAWCSPTPSASRSASSPASRVIVTHGHVQPLVRWLTEKGIEAGAFATAFGQDADDDAAAPESAATAASQREAEGGQTGDEHAAG